MGRKRVGPGTQPWMFYYYCNHYGGSGPSQCLILRSGHRGNSDRKRGLEYSMGDGADDKLSTRSRNFTTRFPAQPGFRSGTRRDLAR